MRNVSGGKVPVLRGPLSAALAALALVVGCSSDAEPSATSSAATTSSTTSTTALDASSEAATSGPSGAGDTDDTANTETDGTDGTDGTETASTDTESSNSDGTGAGVPPSTGPIDPGMTLSTDITSPPPMLDPPPDSSLASVPPTTDPVPTFAAYHSEVYSDPAHWICRGDTHDVCDESYPLSEIEANGESTTIPYVVAEDPPIDCFYVYPTTSGDPTFNSDLTADSEIGVTTYQAARFNQVCRMYAPTYRSVTIAGLFGSAAGNFGDGWNIAYADVLDAWRSYLANDNGGRPVVLLGHSQGSFHLTRLLREQIDPSPAERSLVVSAILAGASFQVANGSDVGGDTQHIPLCRSNGQFGCIVTYQTYRDSEPPTPGALFGAPSGSTSSACTNPAALAGGPGLLEGSMAAGEWVLDDPVLRAQVATGLVNMPGLITSECKVTAEGYNYLAVTVNADPNDPRADDIPGDGSPNWGLHSIDVNVAQVTLIEMVRQQSAAYVAAHD